MVVNLPHACDVLRGHHGRLPRTFVGDHAAEGGRIRWRGADVQLLRANSQQHVAIVHAAAKDNYRFESIVLGVVKSDAFQLRQVPQSASLVTQNH